MNKLGEHMDVVIFYDPEMGSTEILAGSEKRRTLPSGEVFSPLGEYKKSIDTEPFIEDNEDFRPIEHSDRKKREIKWIVGGVEDLQVYKDAIELIHETFKDEQ